MIFNEIYRGNALNEKVFIMINARDEVRVLNDVTMAWQRAFIHPDRIREVYPRVGQNLRIK